MNGGRDIEPQYIFVVVLRHIRIKHFLKKTGYFNFVNDCNLEFVSVRLPTDGLISVS